MKRSSSRPASLAEAPGSAALTLTGAQLWDAYYSVCGCEADGTVGFVHREEWIDKETGEKQPAGIYAYDTEYPEEGLYGPLGVGYSPNAALCEVADKARPN